MNHNTYDNISSLPVKQRRKGWSPLEIFALVLVVCILAASVFVLAEWENKEARAFAALRNAKNVQLAMVAASKFCYASGDKYADVTTDTGFTEYAAEQIQRLSACRGTYRLLRLSGDGYSVTAFMYFENGYRVEYSCEDGEPSWCVYYPRLFVGDTLCY